MLEENYYIGSVYDWLNAPSEGKLIFTNDIDFNGINFTDEYTLNFSGEIEGNGYVVRNIDSNGVVIINNNGNDILGIDKLHFNNIFSNKFTYLFRNNITFYECDLNISISNDNYSSDGLFLNVNLMWCDVYMKVNIKEELMTVVTDKSLNMFNTGLKVDIDIEKSDCMYYIGNLEYCEVDIKVICNGDNIEYNGLNIVGNYLDCNVEIDMDLSYMSYFSITDYVSSSLDNGSSIINLDVNLENISVDFDVFLTQSSIFYKGLIYINGYSEYLKDKDLIDRGVKTSLQLVMIGEEVYYKNIGDYVSEGDLYRRDTYEGLRTLGSKYNEYFKGFVWG